ncbi:MAG: putative malate transporter YflS [Candidatus Poribacteria bacterium]|nr:MAG: putative malate transporter YflS [Candidatus Poribacteria bacterium]
MYDTHWSLRERLIRLGVCLVSALLFWVLPSPSGLPVEAWRVFAVFVGVILGILLRPYPMSVMTLLGLIMLVVLGVVPLDEALSGFADSTVWLVVAAFLFAGAIVRTGLGERIALALISRLGRSMVGLGYAIAVSEWVLGPVIPSNTARGGGVLAPIVRSMAEALGSWPEREPERAGRYLMLVGAHSNLIAAATFLTGMAANPLVVRAAADVFGIEFSWPQWFLGAVVPSLAGMAVLPWILRTLVRPTLEETAPAQQAARARLAALGPWSWRQRAVAVLFALLILLWATKPLHGLGTTTVALVGVGLLLLLRIDSWEGMLQTLGAWDALVWLGGLLSLADRLREYGFIAWFVERAATVVQGFSPLIVALALGIIYFYSMYGFSMLTGHISAMVGAFFAVALAAGAPPLLVVPLFAYLSNLCGCLTNYSTGPVIIYYGFGYVSAPRWLSVGFLIGLVHLIVWVPLGLGWWKVLGWW